MTLTQAVRRATEFLVQEREALHMCHVNPSTGKVEDARARDALTEIDELVNFFRAYLASIEEAQHVL